MSRAILIAFLGILVAGCGGEKTVSPTGPVEGPLPKAEQGVPAKGKTVYADNGCGACHTFVPAGSKGMIGPNLSVVLKGKDAAFVTESITNPNAEIAPGYQPDVMPKEYGSQLDAKQLADLVAFLQTG